MADLDTELDALFPDEDDAPAPKVVETVASAAATVTDVDPDDFDLADLTGMEAPRDLELESKLNKPWMKFHEFTLVKTIEQLSKVVDDAIAHRSCGLDLETEGLDNRIDYDDQGRPQTKHKIVGFCLSVAGHGYYAPVRHRFEAIYGQADPNLPVDQAEAEIRRLCQAAQPVIDPEAAIEDPLGSKKLAEPPKVVIGFWNSKFDQEFLYPITGIDFWHPDSFEDAQLARYVFYTDDGLKLKDKAKEFLKVKDPSTGTEYPYEMIRFEDLFPKEIKKSDRQIQQLYPEDGSIVVKYGCSDAICTELLTPLFLGHLKEQSTKPLGKGVFWTYRLEKQAVQAVRLMERTRTKIDAKIIAELLEEARKALDELETNITELAKSRGFLDFNPGSPKQLGDFLFGDNGLDISPKPAKNVDSDQYKTDAKTLEALLDGMADPPPVFKWIIFYRQVEKVISTYLERFLQDCDEHHCLRFNFNQVGAVTGRFTAPSGDAAHGYFGGPIQGIPARDNPKKHPMARSLRRAFIAHDGYTLVKCDYSGQELRIVTNVSGEPLWTNEFLNGDGDLHTLTARAFFNKDQVTKDERNSGKCVHPDTLIYLDGRLATIGTLPMSAEDLFKEVDHITETGSGPGRVTATYNGGTKPLIHVVTSGGILTCTPAHKFQLETGEFRSAGDLQTGDKLQPVDLPPVAEEPYEPLSLSLWEGIPESLYVPSHDLAYFAGVYAGDGSGNSSSAVICHGSPDVKDAYGGLYEDWIRNLEDSCVRCGFTTTRKDPGSLYLGSRVFVRYLDALGMQKGRAKSLRIPAWVLAAGQQALLHYFGGLFDTDGTVGINHNLEWTTKDFVFGGQVAAALRSCGLDFNTELSFNKTYERYYVRLRLTVASSWSLQPYMRYAGKRDRLREPQYAGRVADRYTVSKVLPAGDSPCVDISVGESHVYLANGFKTHNTANFALIYGGGIQAIQRATGVDKIEAGRKKQAFDQSVPVFAKWLKGQHVAVKKNLGIVTAFGRWISIPDANLQVGDTLPGTAGVADVPTTKKIRASCERKSVNFPIQGSGADIMKISLVRLTKEFYKRRWLRNGGDDSVRMLMTVHDEIVFEVRDDRLEEAVDLICEVMESPWKLVHWKVPLVVEPLIGKGWDAKYDWVKIKKGLEAVPEWLVGHVTPGTAPPKASLVPAAPQPTQASAPTPIPSSPPPPQPPKSNGNGTQEAVVFSLSSDFLTDTSIKIVGACCCTASDRDGKLLLLTDSSGHTLIDPSLGIRVDPVIFGVELRARNLGHGEFRTTVWMGNGR